MTVAGRIGRVVTIVVVGRRIGQQAEQDPLHRGKGVPVGQTQRIEPVIPGQTAAHHASTSGNDAPQQCPLQSQRVGHVVVVEVAVLVHDGSPARRGHGGGGCIRQAQQVQERFVIHILMLGIVDAYLV